MIKYNKLSVLLTVFALFFCISAIGTVNALDEGLADTASPKFHIDSNNTGQSDYTGPQTNNTSWNLTSGRIYYSSPVIGADGTIYIGSYDKNLYALNPDGTKKWNYTTGSYILGSPAIGADGTIYIGSYDKNLYAFRDDGTQATKIWNYTTGGYIYGSPAIGADGTIYIGSYDNNLYALNPDGTKKWNYTTGRIQGCPAIGADGTIYIGSYIGGTSENYFYALRDDGTHATEKWHFTADSYIYGSPAIGADGTIYFGDNINTYALTDNGNSYTEKWRYNGTGRISGSPAIGTDGTIYFGSENRYLYALTDNGIIYTEKWKKQLDGSIYGSPTIGADGTIYVGSNDYKIYALDPLNGDKIWSYTTGGYIYSTPTIGSDGTLYIGSYDGKFYAFKENLPTANFTADNIIGTVPLTVQFTDTSSGTPTSWAWDFDNDGNVDSTEQNPTYIYNTPGTYTVKLTVSNDVGNDEEVKTDYITVNEPPTADVRVKLYTTNGQYTWHYLDTFYIMVDVKNNGPDTATGVQVTNQLPTGLQFLAATPTLGTYDSNTGIWDIGTLANGQCVVLTIKVQAVTPDTILQNTVTKTAENEYDPVTSNNIATRTFIINPAETRADIRVKLYPANKQYAWNQGDIIELVVDVKNNGPETATGVQVTNQLPAGLQFVSYTAGQGTYDSNTGIWNIGTLTSGQCTGLHIFVQAINTGVIQNTVTKTAENEYDPVTSNDSATTTLTIN